MAQDSTIDRDAYYRAVDYCRRHLWVAAWSEVLEDTGNRRWRYILRDRHAPVVVYDYCFSACANYPLIASDLTYVLKGSSVLRHNSPGPGFYAFLATPVDGSPRKVQRDLSARRST